MKEDSSLKLNSVDLIDKGKYLISQGWAQKNQMIFVKEELEIFFDNSNAIELYKIRKPRTRLADFYVVTVRDLIPMLAQVREVKIN